MAWDLIIASTAATWKCVLTFSGGGWPENHCVVFNKRKDREKIALLAMLDGTKNPSEIGLSLNAVMSLRKRRLIKCLPLGSVPIYRTWDNNVREVSEAIMASKLALTSIGARIIPALVEQIAKEEATT